MSPLLFLLPLEIWLVIANRYLNRGDYKNFWYVLPEIRTETRHPYAERISRLMVSRLVYPEPVTRRLIRRNGRDRCRDTGSRESEASS